MGLLKTRVRAAGSGFRTCPQAPGRTSRPGARSGLSRRIRVHEEVDRWGVAALRAQARTGSPAWFQTDTGGQPTDDPPVTLVSALGARRWDIGATLGVAVRALVLSHVTDRSGLRGTADSATPAPARGRPRRSRPPAPTLWVRCPRSPWCPRGPVQSISTPGLSRPAGSTAFLAARRAAANGSGR